MILLASLAAFKSSSLVLCCFITKCESVNLFLIYPALYLLCFPYVQIHAFHEIIFSHYLCKYCLFPIFFILIFWQFLQLTLYLILSFIFLKISFIFPFCLLLYYILNNLFQFTNSSFSYV